MKFDDLNIFFKYCYNRIGEEDFISFMMERYNDENYISNLWPQFRDNPIMFIISRQEIELFNNITLKIQETNYKG